MNRAPLSWIFWLGVVLVGMILPLRGKFCSFHRPWRLPALFSSIGGFLFRYSLLKAGVYVAPSIVPAGVDLSKLNRTSSQFEREYAGMANATRQPVRNSE